MAMLYFIANASDCTHQTGLVHSGGSRVDVGPGEWLYAMFIPHVGHAKHYLKEQCKAAGITVEVFPLLKSKNPVSAAALATLTAYLGTALTEPLRPSLQMFSPLPETPGLIQTVLTRR
jgi:hypothetical protein